MKKYDRVVHTFVRKINKLGKIAEKNQNKINILKEKSVKYQLKIAQRIAQLESIHDKLKEEAAMCENTAKKLTDLFS